MEEINKKVERSITNSKLLEKYCNFSVINKPGEQEQCIKEIANIINKHIQQLEMELQTEDTPLIPLEIIFPGLDKFYKEQNEEKNSFLAFPG